MERYDCIVAGTGGVGSAALYHLARAGARAIGIDRFPPGHDRGSSHGDTRIIRLVYHEHPDYVPILRRAYELWDELEDVTATNLHVRTGLLQVGQSNGAVLAGVLESARRHHLDIEELSAEDIARELPGFAIPEGMSGVYEKGGGYLRVEECVLRHLSEAERLGATSVADEAIESWETDGSGIVVRTDKSVYAADRLIVTAGAWAADLLSGLDVPLVVRLKPLFWFGDDDERHRASNGFPGYLFEHPDGLFYGFPVVDDVGIKVAEHTGGQVVDDPLAVERDLIDEDRDRVTKFLSECLPTVSHDVRNHKVCMYTMTADEHFVVDRHPADPRVVFAAGLSGHGFKFTSVLGETLTDLALDKTPRVPIEFLSSKRPGLKPAES